jgi:putative ABC transport system substrate-binding protein
MRNFLPLLQGAKPEDLPVEQPTQLELIRNRQTAEALWFTSPPVLLFQAREVIR